MNLNRRSFLQIVGTCAAGLGLPAVVAPRLRAAGAATPDSAGTGGDDPALRIGDDVAIATTTYGKVRGFVLNGITTFRGIPYGADTSGANRFMPPRRPASWTGIRPAVWWGDSAPQDMTNRYADPYQDFVDHWNYDVLSEDCLKLNLWTPALADGKKRPVMVWLHGGGYVAGNAIEQDGYDGENLARRGDVVFCSLNHRLGPCGYSNFAAVGGEPFAASGNVGMLDIVAALEWIRDNIAAFGGDPDNVTISGQSGGGSKVCTLAAMPSAKGLFHKAVALSGNALSGLDRDFSEKLGSRVAAEAGLAGGDLRRLQEMPWHDYQMLAQRAQAKLEQEMPERKGFRGGFRPVADGTVLPTGRFFADPNGLSADVPMLLCSTFNEMSPSRSDSAKERVTLDEVKAALQPRFGDQAGAIVDAYQRQFPHRKPVEIWSLAASNRQAVVATAEAKSRQPAPVYVAWFGFQPELFDGRMRAFHCLDISFWFYNTDRMYTHTGGGAKARRLSARMADAMVQFMRTGNPNSGSLPEWPRFTAERGETMVLDLVSEVQNDPDRAARQPLPPLRFG